MEGFSYANSFAAIAPEIGLTIMAMVILFLDVYLPESQRRNIAYVAFFGLLATAVTPLLWAPNPAVTEVWGGMVRHDGLSQIFKVMVVAAGAITCLLAVDVEGLGRRGEFYLIITVSTLGACLVSAAGDLVMVFVGLETISIPLYILATFQRDDLRSSESGMKYFLFGSFASAIMLYGFSLLYGFSGATRLDAIAAFMGSPDFGANLVPVLSAMLLILVGLGFKISAAPFHFWTPDVYEGAPTPVTAFVSVASKAASFALLVRFFILVFPVDLTIGGQALQVYWVPLIAVLATITMTLGNVLALPQKNIKRLLAYSSVAQAGYALMGVAAIQAQTGQGVAAVSFYMFMYTFTNLAAFAVVIIFSNNTGSETIADLAGLSRRNPWLAIAMTVALLSLAGIPPAAGFMGKFFLFQAAVEANLVWLAIVGVLNALVALYYYLIVIKVMYVDHSEDEDKPIPVSPTYGWVLAATTVIVLILGTVGAQVVFEWAERGAQALFI